MKRFLITLVLLTVFFSLFTMTGCKSPTKISDVLAAPENYATQDVTIKGTVGESFWFSEKGGYQLGDGTDTIWIVTTQPPPQKGETVTTEGHTQSTFSFLGKSYGTVLIETKRQ